MIVQQVLAALSPVVLAAQAGMGISDAKVDALFLLAGSK